MLFKEGQSIYSQIADRLADEVLSGVYAPGERVPSVREYAAQVGVNVNTVVRAYEWLSAHEVICNRRGLGYYVCPEAAASIRQARREAFFRERLPALQREMRLIGVTNREVCAFLMQDAPQADPA